MVAKVEAELGPIDLLVANAGIGDRERRDLGGRSRASGGACFEVNVLGVHLSCRAVIPGMLERGRGRIVITGSGAAYLPGSRAAPHTRRARRPSAATARRSRNELRGRIPVFVFSPGLVKTEMTSVFGDDMPWTPPELAPRLVRVLASGRADALAGRYIHAEHDDIEDLIARADEIEREDLNAIRLQR